MKKNPILEYVEKNNFCPVQFSVVQHDGTDLRQEGCKTGLRWIEFKAAKWKRNPSLEAKSFEMFYSAWAGQTNIC